MSQKTMSGDAHDIRQVDVASQTVIASLIEWPVDVVRPISLSMTLIWHELTFDLSVGFPS